MVREQTTEISAIRILSKKEVMYSRLLAKAMYHFREKFFGGKAIILEEENELMMTIGRGSMIKTNTSAVNNFRKREITVVSPILAPRILLEGGNKRKPTRSRKQETS